MHYIIQKPLERGEPPQSVFREYLVIIEFQEAKDQYSARIPHNFHLGFVQSLGKHLMYRFYFYIFSQFLISQKFEHHLRKTYSLSIFLSILFHEEYNFKEIRKNSDNLTTFNLLFLRPLIFLSYAPNCFSVSLLPPFSSSTPINPTLTSAFQ